MSNISQEKLDHLASDTGSLINVINEGVKWVDSYLKDSDKTQTNYELKKYRRYLKNIREVVTKKTVLSLFGRSQVGKSYLVAGLLSTDDEPELQIPDWHTGKMYKFIGEMNPPGGKESTGVVSRFSIEKNDHTHTDHPIEVKLLSPKDIILILCDAYFSDIKYHEHTEAEFENSALELLEQLPRLSTGTAQHYLTEDDVFDIKDYMSKFKDKPIRVLSDRFWDVLAESIIKINPEQWGKVFQVLWGKNNRFTELFSMLITDLRSLEFSPKVFAEINALLVSGGTILDVQRIKELYDDPCKAVTVATASGQIKPIQRSKLAALTYEVIIPVKEELANQKIFLKNVDVLDFPGARQREVYDEKRVKELEDDYFFDFYIRGKVSYLFNRYTENFEISSLLFCIDDQQLEVKDIPSLLNTWISYYLGPTIEERTESLLPDNAVVNPLFIIFTKANIMLQYKDIDGSGNFDYKWETRFKSIFINEYCKGYDWPENWIRFNGAVEKFKNMYLLRNFRYPESIYEGFLDHQKETNISKSREAYMSDLRKSFVENSFNRAHFQDPARSWQEFTDLNKDGTQFIIENLTPVSTNRIRTRRYVNLLNDYRDKASKTISHHYRSSEADAQIKKAAKEGSDLQLKMDIVFGADAYYFGNFIEHLTLSETEVLKFFHDLLRSDKLIRKQETNKYILLRAQNPDITPDLSYDQNVEILRRNYNKTSTEETLQYFQEKEGIDLNELFYGDLYNLQNNSLILAEEAMNYWFDHKLTIEQFTQFVDLGFDKGMLSRLFENLKLSFTRSKLTKHIAKEIRTYVDVSKRIDTAEDMIAHITAGIINEFVTSVGWSYYSDAEKLKIRESNKANQLNLTIPNDEEVFKSMERVTDTETQLMSVEKLIDYMYELNDRLSRIPIEQETLEYVPMIKNYQRWSELMKISFIANCDIPNYNIEANKLLGNILERIQRYQFQIS
jgi:hypothetical protein